MLLLKRLWKKALRPLYSTEADTFITEELLLLLKAQEKAAWNSN